MNKIIKFAHLADLHLGGWREKELTRLNFETFKIAIDKVISSEVDFCLFAGDIFNSPMPPLDIVNLVAKELLKLKDANIPLYVIGGSHDYSATGKSFIKLLETVGVFVDVGRWESLDNNSTELILTTDPKTKTLLGGILGKRNGLDKTIYKNLNQLNLNTNVFKIFLFHTTLNDFKPEFMKAVNTPVQSSYLPPGFDYYAGGHVHTYIEGKYSTGYLSYPGPLFPNNFRELIREKPSFNLCQFDVENRKISISRQYLETYEKEHIYIKVKNYIPSKVSSLILEKINELTLTNKIVLLEVEGIVEGKVSEVNFKEILELCYKKSALCVLKNTSKLTPKTLEDVENLSTDFENSSEIEKKIVLDKLKETKEINTMENLLKLNLEKNEEEKVISYEKRTLLAMKESLNLIK